MTVCLEGVTIGKGGIGKLKPEKALAVGYLRVLSLQKMLQQGTLLPESLPLRGRVRHPGTGRSEQTKGGSGQQPG